VQPSPRPHFDALYAIWRIALRAAQLGYAAFVCKALLHDPWLFFIDHLLGTVFLL
jgi:hypothetical protein